MSLDERNLAGLDSVQQFHPALPGVILVDHQRKAVQGSRDAGLERGAQRSELEPPVLDLGKNADTRQRAQDAVGEGRRDGAGPCARRVPGGPARARAGDRLAWES